MHPQRICPSQTLGRALDCARRADPWLGAGLRRNVGVSGHLNLAHRVRRLGSGQYHLFADRQSNARSTVGVPGGYVARWPKGWSWGNRVCANRHTGC